MDAAMRKMKKAKCSALKFELLHLRILRSNLLLSR